MRNLKRALASILAVAMLSTSVNVGFAATANFSDVDSKYSAAVTRLAGIDILTGYEDGTFKPEGTITRAEAAAVMVRMLGKEKLASYSAGVSQFSDMTTSHWANGYVNVAASAGLVKGYEDGTFGPEKQVTYAEMVTMMVRAIGAGEAVGSSGTWPNNYLNFALTEGLTDDVAVVPNAPATRGDVAIMANQTLDTTMWEATGYNTDGTRTYAKAEDDTKTLFIDKLELTKYEMYTVEGTGLAVSNGDFSFTAGKDGDDAGSTIDAGEISNFTFADGLATPVYPGEEVDMLTNKDGEVVSIQHAKDSKQKVVVFNDVTKMAASKVEVELADGTKKSYDYSTTPAAVKTTNGTSFATDADLDLPGRALVNKDGKVTNLFTYNYSQAMVVKEVKEDTDNNKYTIKADTTVKYNDSSLVYNLDDDVVYVNTPAGVPMTVSDIKEGDMVIYSADKTYLMVYPANVVEGTVDATDADQISIDGTDYDFSYNLTSKIDNVSVDDSVKAYLDPMGQIATLEKVTGGSSSSGDYGIITDFYAETSTGKSTVTPKIELFDLKSGVTTGLKTMDAEKTDKEATTSGKPAFAGYDFFNESASTDSHASSIGKITVTSNALDAGDKVTAGTTTYTVVAGATTAATATNIATALNADAAVAATAVGNVVSVVLESPTVGGVVTLSEVDNATDNFTVVSGAADTDNTLAKTARAQTEVVNGSTTGYTDVVGKIVKYEIADDKVVIYPVADDEIRQDAATNFDKDTDKYKMTAASNVGSYYVDPDAVKVYQATEMGSSDKVLTVKAIDYATLKDMPSVSAQLVDFDTDIENASFVYLPLVAGLKQDLAKNNTDTIGVITKARELSGENVEVTVLTTDGEVKFYVAKDEKDNIDTFALNGRAITLDDNNDFAAFKGLLVAYSADADSYVTSENVLFSNDLRTSKYYETNSKNEVKLLDAQTDAPAAYSAYSSLAVLESDITAKSAVSLSGATLAGGADLTPATGTITVTNNTFDAGDTVTAGTTTYTVVAGATAGDTATAIATALDADGAVAASATGNVVTVTASVAGIAGNTLALSEVDNATNNLTLVAMHGGTAVAAAKGTITLNSKLLEGDTVTVDGTVFTKALLSDATSDFVTVDDLVAEINGALATVTATAIGNVITVTAVTPEAAGNLIEIETSATYPTATVLTNLADSTESSIDEADKTLDTEWADAVDHSTVYYYLVEVDKDGKIVDLDTNTMTLGDDQNITTMIFDPSELN